MESGLSLARCEKCNEPTGKEINLFGKKRIVPVMCKCKKVEYETKKLANENQDKQIRLQQMFTNSMMSAEFKKYTFQNWDKQCGNEHLYKIAIKYTKSFTLAREKNLGLLIHGTKGTGKTYSTGCIANELIKQGYPVICVSIINLLERIKKNFNSWGDSGTQEILNALNNADLLIIDDLGTENNTAWVRAMIYNIIDDRYRRKKPLIVTTNLTLEELKSKYDVDGSERTYDRLVSEMCTPIRINGDSIRRKKGQEKLEHIKKIMG